MSALHHRPADRPLPAAVLREDDPGADRVARVVPRRARLVMIGTAVAGYYSPRKARWQFCFRSRRVAEIDALARLRYQAAPPPPAAARAFAEAVAHHAEPNEAAQWIDRWCVRLNAAERAAIVADAAASPRRWRAVELGELLKLRRGERQLLGIRTFRAQGQTRRDLTEANKRRKLERQRAARAARPAKPMSNEKTKPWIAEGVSRRTWYARKARAANVAVPCTENEPSKYTHLFASKSVQPSETFATSPSGSAPNRIIAALRNGPLDVSTIVRLTGLDHRVVRPALTRLLSAGRIIRISRGVYRRTEQQTVVAAQGGPLVRNPVGPAPDQPGARERASGHGRGAGPAAGAIGSSGAPLPVRCAAPRVLSVFAPCVFAFPFPIRAKKVLHQ